MDLIRLQNDKRLLSFPAAAPTPTRPISDTLELINISPTDVAFKIKTTYQSRYIVRPHVGVIPVNGTLTILIGMQPTPLAPDPGPSKDKFLLLVTAADGLAERGLPSDYWVERESGPDVGSIKFKVEFVDVNSEQELVDDVDAVHPVLLAPETPEKTHVPRQRDLPPAVQTSGAKPPVMGEEVSNVVTGEVASVMQSSLTKEALSPAVLGSPLAELVSLDDADELLQEGNYEAAVRRAKELQAMLDLKNLELARLRMELAETRGESERVLEEAPTTPLSANKVLSDPFGGVSVAGFGLMVVLFVILVNVILRIV